MNKRGQFFLIAALVIAGIIITLTTINISTRTSSTNTAIYDLSKEIDYESSSLIDYGVFEGDSSVINAKLEALIANYSAANPYTNITFLYGTKDSLTIFGGTYGPKSTGSVGTGGTWVLQVQNSIEPINVLNPSSSNKKEIQLPDKTVITIDFKEGQNFYLVLKKQSGGETIVAKNQNE